MKDAVLLEISTALADLVAMLEEKSNDAPEEEDRIASAIEAMTQAMSSLKAPQVQIDAPPVVIPPPQVVVNGTDISFSFDVDVDAFGQITGIRGTARRLISK